MEKPGWEAIVLFFPPKSTEECRKPRNKLHKVKLKGAPSWEGCRRWRAGVKSCWWPPWLSLTVPTDFQDSMSPWKVLFPRDGAAPKVLTFELLASSYATSHIWHYKASLKFSCSKDKL